MSDSFAPGKIVVELIDPVARCGDAGCRRRTPIRFMLIAAVLPALFVSNNAMAQVSGMASPTPSMGATSPLGITSGSSVSPTGIPLGSTEIASPGVSPLPTSATGTIAMPGSGTTCSTLGTSPSTMYGSTATYDGGGTAVGAATPATGATSGISASSGATSGMSTTSGMMETAGMSGMCGSGSSSVASSSTPTSPTAPGGVARTGIPLGSLEIGNLGVSSAAAVPTLSVAPTVGSVVTSAPMVPTIPLAASPSTVSSPTTSLFPCPTTGLAGTSNTPGGC
jgi:hypothetical protein